MRAETALNNTLWATAPQLTLSPNAEKDPNALDFHPSTGLDSCRAATVELGRHGYRYAKGNVQFGYLPFEAQD
jgi:hypothetical protein